MPRLPIRWGLSLPNRGVLFGLTTLDAIMEAAGFAENSGVFESVWFGDSLIHKPRLESVVMLAAVAARTRRVRLGVMCMATFAVRDPVLLAIQWATLDQISNGRTVLGVCIGGGHQPELDAFGVKRSDRVARLEEGIELLRKIWHEEEVFHIGRFYHLEGYRIVPKPVQKPVPVWIAVSPDRKSVGGEIVDAAMRRVGRLADGYITMGVSPEEFQMRWNVIEASALAGGRSLRYFETSMHGMVNINDDRREAYRESKLYFDRYYGPGYPPEELLKVWLAHGSPRECASLIQSWIDMGITTPVLRFATRDQVGQIRRFCRDVLPLLRVD
jgi:alkanesulfonate monooxygenase SsuD/methylene tetrahydromethanopterin reductase-like flavin-dependent oxidoreductase (luciferase family)